MFILTDYEKHMKLNPCGRETRSIYKYVVSANYRNNGGSVSHSTLLFFSHNYYNTRATLISTTYRLLLGTRP